MSTINEMIEDIIRVEGGYVDHPDDRGGPTKYGITGGTLSKYRGFPCGASEVEAMEVDEARRIYNQMYVVDPGFGRVAQVDDVIAAELVDTGVNMGPGVASVFLQRALNALNDKQELYPDLTVDGRVGAVTVAALTRYLTVRSRDVMLKALNCLQGARYIALAENRERNESFVYGWLQQRVALP